MTIRVFAHSGIAVTLLMVVATTPPASSGQASKPADVRPFLGTWSGDTKANEAAFKTGLFPKEQGLKISTTSDALVVITTYRRPTDPAGDPWTDGDRLSYKLDGSTSPGTLNGLPAATKLAARDGDTLVLDAVHGRTAEPMQTMIMSIERDRLKVEWSRGRFTATLFYVRSPSR